MKMLVAGILFSLSIAASASERDLYEIAAGFGRLHQGVGQFSEEYSPAGLESLGFVTGDGMSCRVYAILPTFKCTDSRGSCRYYKSNLRAVNRPYAPCPWP